ncbi:MAG: hypothetical protein FWD57_12260 [Polyangiaceae bacterium]|nr:hypothetical protein [Polyangiaceae bacterium]
MDELAVTPTQIARLARLMALDLSPTEVQGLAADLTATLEYVAQTLNSDLDEQQHEYDDAGEDAMWLRPDVPTH